MRYKPSEINFNKYSIRFREHYFHILCDFKQLFHPTQVCFARCLSSSSHIDIYTLYVYTLSSRKKEENLYIKTGFQYTMMMMMMMMMIIIIWLHFFRS